MYVYPYIIPASGPKHVRPHHLSLVTFSPTPDCVEVDFDRWNFKNRSRRSPTLTCFTTCRVVSMWCQSTITSCTCPST